MELTKTEIQKMLREMKVKFNIKDSYEDLQHLLKKEHHNEWLKSIFETKNNNKIQKSFIRKKTSNLKIKNQDKNKKFNENI